MIIHTSPERKKDIYKKLNPNDYAIYMATLHSYKKAIFDRVLLGTKNIPDYLIHFKNKDEEIPKVFNYNNLLTEHMKPSDTQSRIGLSCCKKQIIRFGIRFERKTKKDPE